MKPDAGLKDGARVLALDDSYFSKKDKHSVVIGVIGRGTLVEGMISFKVDVDGDDSANMLIRAVKSSRFCGQVKLIALNGITFAGLNIIDVPMVERSLKVPVIAVTRKRPRRSLLGQAISKRAGSKAKLEKFREVVNGIVVKRWNGFHIQLGNTRLPSDAVLDSSVYMLRLAHIIASGIRLGESKGRI